MKKSIVYSVAFVFIYSLCCSTIAFSQNRSINFEQGTWQEVIKKAKSEHKIIFLASYWDMGTGYKNQDNNIFSTDAVADFYNEHFISCKIDPEKGDGPLLAAKYHIECSTAFLFLDDREEVLHRDNGTKTVPEFIALGETALNPEKRFEAWQTKYRRGNREPAFIRQYIKMFNPYGNEAREIADWYFTTQKNEELLTKENFEMIKQYVESDRSPAFQYLVAQRAKYRELFGAEEVDKKIFDVYHYMIIASHTFVKPSYEVKVDEKRFNEVKDEIKKSGFEKSEELLMYADVWYYDETKNAKKYAEASVLYVNKYRINDYDYLNYTAWYFYAHDEITDGSVLNQALAWAKKSVDNNPNVAAYEAYASILYKMNRKKEALQAVQTSIEMKQKEGRDISSSKYLLDKIQAMK